MPSSWLNNHLSTPRLSHNPKWDGDVVSISPPRLDELIVSVWETHPDIPGFLFNYRDIFAYSPPVTQVTPVFILWAERTPFDPVTGTSGSLVRKKEAPRATLHLTDVPSLLVPVFSLSHAHTLTHTPGRKINLSQEGVNVVSGSNRKLDCSQTLFRKELRATGSLEDELYSITCHKRT